MITLALAVLIASFLGSLHCVGMCGPFALWATHGGSARVSLAAYHVGRLTTYLSAGLAAGVLGSMLEIGGEVAGYQSLAAKVAGGLLIFFGIARLLLLLPWFGGKPAAATVESKPSLVATLLQRLKPVIAGRGPLARAYFVGFLTTWLPCGWLYLFVLIAAGTGEVPPGDCRDGRFLARFATGLVGVDAGGQAVDSTVSVFPALDRRSYLFY